MPGQHGGGRVLERGLFDFQEGLITLKGGGLPLPVLVAGGLVYNWLRWLLIFLRVLLQIIS
jgi:hypothetical protein